MSAFNTVLAQLYIGYFGRAPEPAGFTFWQNALDNGFSVAAAAQDFAGQPETLAQYPFLADPDVNDIETFLDAVYQNLFGRSTDAAGLAFWSGQIQNGLPLGTAILNIIEGAAPADAAVLANKVDLALRWHDLAAVEPDFVYDDAAETSSREALALVSDDPASVEAGSDADNRVIEFFNDAPTLSVTPVLATIAEDADTSAATKVADIAVTDDGLGNNQLSLTGADAALFEIVGTELFLSAGAALDFETAASLDVTVVLDDPAFDGTVNQSAAVPIAIGDVNEVPALTLTSVVTTLSEDADTSARIKVADVAITDDALGTNTLSLSGADAALFEIDGTELFLRAGTTLDVATAAQLDVTVELDDADVGATPDDSASLSIAISDVNAAPTLALTQAVASLAEDTDTSARIKIADVVINDDGDGVNALSLSGADAGSFELDGTELFLRAGAALDFETAATLDVTVAVDDAGVGGTPDDSASLTLAVTDVNEAPELSASIAQSVLAEDIDTGTRIKLADLTVADDALGSVSFLLSGPDAALFEIDGTELFFSAGGALDFETASTLNVTVSVDDPAIGTGAETSTDLSFTIGDANEAPGLAATQALTTLSEGADTAARIKVADLTVTDDGLGNNVLSLSGDDAALFEIDGTEVFLRAGSVLDFETDANLDVTVELDDADIGSGPDDSVALNIAVTDANEVPGLSLTALVSDLSEDTDTSARVKVADLAVTDDALGSAALSLSGADAALFEIDGTEVFLRAGTTLDFETDAQLEVTVELDDPDLGTGAEATAPLTINITDANEAPALAIGNLVQTLSEDTDTTVRIKLADLNISDDALGSNTLALAGTDAALFELDGTELFLRAGTTLDFETAPSLSVTVTVDDAGVGATPDASVDVTLSVTDVPEAPIAGDDIVTGPEARVNSILTLDQSDPALTTLSNGNVVMLWRSEAPEQGDASGSGIKGRILDPAGNQVVAEFLVNGATTGDQDLPAVTALAGGSFVASWQSQGDVAGRVFSATGNSAGADFSINTQTAGDQSDVALSALPGGGFIAVWESGTPAQGDASGSGIKARVFDATGAEAEAESLVNSLTTGDQAAPAVAALSNGNLVIAWTADVPSDGDTNGTALKARVIQQDGTEVVPEFLVNQQTFGLQRDAAITALDTGGFVVTWVSNDGRDGDTSSFAVKGRVFDSAGAAAGDEFQVNTFTAGFQLDPVITTLTDGSFVAVWTSQDRSQGDSSVTAVQARLYEADGTPKGAEFRVNDATPGAQETPAVTALADGGFVVSWASLDQQAGDTSGTAIKAAYFDGTGARVEVPLVVAEGDAIIIDAADLLANDLDPDGGALTITEVAGTATGGLTTQGATITVNQDGTLSYDTAGVAAFATLLPGQFITDTFAYEVIDASGQTARAVVSVLVEGRNAAPEVDLT
jgi:hypothetical protein